MAHRTYLTLLIGTTATETTFALITGSGVRYIREIILALEAALSCHAFLSLGSHFVEGKLLLGLLLHLILKVVEVITEADNYESEVILTRLLDLVEANALFQNCLRYFAQGHVLSAKFQNSLNYILLRV